MKKVLLLTLTALSASVCINLSYADKVTEKIQAQTTPQAVLKRLQTGNEHFYEGKSSPRNLELMRFGAAKGQHPLAIVLACVDARSIPEVALSQKKGSMFAARVAGNVVNTDILGSMEFAVGYAGAKAIVVLGHTQCGAVAAACSLSSKIKGNLRKLLLKIAPAVKRSKKMNPNGKCSDPQFVNFIAKQNVIEQMHQILKKSKLIRKLVKENKVVLVGGIQDLKTGKITFFDRQ